jgi:hypothetical protein
VSDTRLTVSALVITPWSLGSVGADSDPIATIEPVHLLDTRSNGETIDTQSQATGRLDASAIITIQIAGRANIPDDAAGVMLNLAAIDPDGNGFATLYPCTTTPPLAASLDTPTASTSPRP